MEQESNTFPLPIRQIEIDILKAAHEFGLIPNDPESPAFQWLQDKYESNEESQQANIVLNYLLEERLIFPFFVGLIGERRDSGTRGITPKGLDRLDRLVHPRRIWMKENWFALMVAAAATMTSLAGLVVQIWG